ncbi:MAG: hypothetical protein HQM03_07335 [Magnetococcales bacterium]|nr:hypothetical protein [Magnetococcales bacterium]
MSNEREPFIPQHEEIMAGCRKITATYQMLDELLLQAIDGFQWRGGQEGLYSLSPALLQDIAIRVERDKERFRHFHGSKHPDPDKVGGMLVYWIAKRRPIVYMDWKIHPPHTLTSDEYLLNEYLAIFAGINRVLSARIKINNPEDLAGLDFPQIAYIMREWRYSLAYRNFNSDDMTMLLKLCLSCESTPKK